MEINKASWSTDGDNLTIGMSLSKIDKERRIVSGWATLDNPDQQDDIVLAEANRRAFERFRGNIREMHQPIAAGRLLKFKEDSFFDPETNRTYNGIWVDVYVSKGAQSTWEKVLDGTLSGFSIHGPVIDKERQFSKSSGRGFNIIKDYKLTELSLVDSPANQLANVVNVMKFVDGEDGDQHIEGILADVKSENVFWCPEHKVAKTSTDENVDCPSGDSMTSIGWIEYNDSDKENAVASLVNKYLADEQALPAKEGGVDVAEETKPETVDEGVAVSEQGKAENEVTSSVEEVDENGAAQVEGEVAGPEQVAEGTETVEESGTVEPVEETATETPKVEEPEVAKMFDDLKDALTTQLRKTNEEVAERVEKATSEFGKKFEELSTSHTELVNKFNSLKENIESVEERVTKMAGSGAEKKSGDLGGSTENTLTKSNGKGVWGGLFLDKH